MRCTTPEFLDDFEKANKWRQPNVNHNQCDVMSSLLKLIATQIDLVRSIVAFDSINILRIISLWSYVVIDKRCQLNSHTKSPKNSVFTGIDNIRFDFEFLISMIQHFDLPLNFSSSFLKIYIKVLTASLTIIWDPKNG